VDQEVILKAGNDANRENSMKTQISNIHLRRRYRISGKHSGIMQKINGMYVRIRNRLEQKTELLKYIKVNKNEVSTNFF